MQVYFPISGISASRLLVLAHVNKMPFRQVFPFLLMVFMNMRMCGLILELVWNQIVCTMFLICLQSVMASQIYSFFYNGLSSNGAYAKYMNCSKVNF